MLFLLAPRRILFSPGQWIWWDGFELMASSAADSWHKICCILGHQSHVDMISWYLFYINGQVNPTGMGVEGIAVKCLQHHWLEALLLAWALADTWTFPSTGMAHGCVGAVYRKHHSPISPPPLPVPSSPSELIWPGLVLSWMSGLVLWGQAGGVRLGTSAALVEVNWVQLSSSSLRPHFEDSCQFGEVGICTREVGGKGEKEEV